MHDADNVIKQRDQLPFPIEDECSPRASSSVVSLDTLARCGHHNGHDASVSIYYSVGGRLGFKIKLGDLYLPT